MQGGSRMVVDLARPARIDKAVVLEAANDQPARLVLELAATDREAFMRAPRSRTARRRSASRRHATGDQRIGDARPVIVIDPGHGGIDNGTSAASGEMEKTIVLEFLLALRDKIEKTGKYRVVMTRTDDTFVALGDRVQARAAQAALFISIHADALRRARGRRPGGDGSTRSRSAPPTPRPRAGRGREQGRRDRRPRPLPEPSEVADILIDLAQRETKTFSLQFAHTLVGELKTGPAAQASAEIRGLRGAQGARRALGPGRARLRLEQGRPRSCWPRGLARTARRHGVQAIHTFFSPGRRAGAAGPVIGQEGPDCRPQALGLSFNIKRRGPRGTEGEHRA